MGDLVVEPLGRIHDGYLWTVNIFIVFAYFSVLNVVTGVFCQSAIDSAQHDKDMMIQNHVLHKERYVGKAMALFHSLDGAQSGIITVTQFEDHLQNPEVQAFFDALEVDTSDAWALFKLIDTEENHQIELEEFIDGCLRLKGTAKSIDMVKLLHDQMTLMGWLVDFMEDTESRLCRMADALAVGGFLRSESPGEAPAHVEP